VRRRERKRAERLRHTIDCLPYETRVAMLEGLERYEIIAGAYSERSGGVCPMLAAHRCGGRTDFKGFARAWDRFTGVGKRARRASQRELRTLAAQLEASIWNEERVRELRGHADGLATVKHESRRGRRRRGRAAWLVPFRSLDDYRRGLETALTEYEEAQPYGRPAPARSAGRTIITSGITQAGESRSRHRTTSATS
jgi:hypothetical protein